MKICSVCFREYEESVSIIDRESREVVRISSITVNEKTYNLCPEHLRMALIMRAIDGKYSRYEIIDGIV